MNLFTTEDIFLVTGASSGIGRAVAQMLVEEGASVVGIARNESHLRETQSASAAPERFFIEIKSLESDIPALPQYLRTLKEKYGKFKGLACCAGLGNTTPLRMIDISTIRRIFAINYYAPLFLAKGFADRRVNRGRGSSVVFISSFVANSCDKGMAIYAASKSAVAASAKCVAKELAPMGVRVNVVSPSSIATPMTDGYGDRRDDIMARHPLGFGEPRDVASMIVYLLSERAKWITRQDYAVDCGYM